MHKETIARLIKEYSGEDLAGYLSKAIDDDKRIRIEASNFKKMELEEVNRHAAELERLHGKWVDLTKRCSHHETTYYPDASGNNDSETLCDICGKSL
jgi:hypothetical protein